MVGRFEMAFCKVWILLDRAVIERSCGYGVMVTDRSKVQGFQVGVGGTGISDSHLHNLGCSTDTAGLW